MQGRIVSYLRVSTDRQGKNGLGLEAQRAAVAAHLNGGTWTLLDEMVEVESGKATADRPQLARAMALCRLIGATLCVAKLDRLSRDANFLIGLDKADVDFMAVDMPNANKLTVGIMALVAQQEREATSARTKAALAAAKTRGTKLEGYRGVSPPDPAKASTGRIAKADLFASRVRPLIHELQGSGMTVEAVSRALTAQGVRTERGGSWTGQAVNPNTVQLGGFPDRRTARHKRLIHCHRTPDSAN